MIVQSRKVMRRSWLGLGKTPVYEVTAAVDTLDDGAPVGVRDEPVRLPASAARLYALSQQMMDAEHGTVARPLVAKQVGQILGRKPTVEQIELPPQLTALQERLLSQGLDRAVAESISHQLCFELNEEEVQSWNVVAAAASRQLGRKLQTVEAIDGGEEGPVVIFVVGPTGAGKTTTIAKLAAMFTVQSGARVGLVTSDTLRVGAISQLQAFADILGLPMQVAYSPAELAKAVRRQSSADVILVDTAGFDSKRGSQERLAGFVEAAGRCLVLLAISSTTKEADALAAVVEIDHLPVHGLIFTKIDETRGYGSVFNIAGRTGLPAYYVTTGQTVPDDIELASGERISARLLGMQA